MQVRYNEKDIQSLLDKVREIDDRLGDYQLYAINGSFDYVVKLTNGTVYFTLNELKSNAEEKITVPVLQTIAERFVKEGMPLDTKRRLIESTEDRNEIRFGKIMSALTLVILTAGVTCMVIYLTNPPYKHPGIEGTIHRHKKEQLKQENKKTDKMEVDME